MTAGEHEDRLVRREPDVESLRPLAPGDGPPGDLLLRLHVVHVHERGRVADVPVRLFVLTFQDLEDPRVPADRLVRALRDEVDDPRRALLPVAVHPAVALLEDHEGPRRCRRACRSG